MYPFGDARALGDRRGQAANATFVGFFPAEDPEVTVLISIDEPPGAEGQITRFGGPEVLEIVDPLANVIDARFPLGEVTIIKISSDMRTLAVTPAELSSYKQYENSDCLNARLFARELF